MGKKGKMIETSHFPKGRNLMLESILNKMEYTREKMIQSAVENGVANRETIRLSEELDRLLNEFHFQVNKLHIKEKADLS